MAMVNDKEHHLPRRDLPKNGVRKTNAVEASVAPALERSPQPRVHPLPSPQELSLTAGDFFWREILSWRHEPAAGSPATREAVAVIIAQLDKRARWSASPSKAQAEDPRRDREPSRHRAHRGIQVLKMLARRPGVADAKHEFVRRQVAEEVRDVSLLRGERLEQWYASDRRFNLGNQWSARLDWGRP